MKERTRERQRIRQYLSSAALAYKDRASTYLTDGRVTPQDLFPYYTCLAKAQAYKDALKQYNDICRLLDKDSLEGRL